MVIADFNGDGHLDLVVADQGPDKQLFFIPGHGSAGFGAAVAFGGPSENTWSVDAPVLAAAELRPGSGLQDLVLANQGDGGFALGAGSGFGIDVLLGNGDGTFQPATHYVDTTNFDAIGSVGVWDMNGDGIPDLVGVFDDAKVYSTDLGVWLGQGDGTFRESPSILSLDGRTGFAPDSSVAIATVGGELQLLLADEYLSDLVAETVPAACFGPPIECGSGCGAGATCCEVIRNVGGSQFSCEPVPTDGGCPRSGSRARAAVPTMPAPSSAARSTSGSDSRARVDNSARSG